MSLHEYPKTQQTPNSLQKLIIIYYNLPQNYSFYFLKYTPTISSDLHITTRHVEVEEKLRREDRKSQDLGWR